MKLDALTFRLPNRPTDALLFHSGLGDSNADLGDDVLGTALPISMPNTSPSASSAQGNYDEFRFFTGLRPSEQIALVLSDLDLANGIVSVNKARVSGVDRCKTKTGEERRVHLCPRALRILERQLRLREHLVADRKIDHDHVFVLDSGEPIRNLHIPATRWRKTLLSLKALYRRPIPHVIRR